MTGFPITNIWWVKDGQPLRIGARVRLLARDQISITSVSKEDRGMYQCFAKNDYHTVQATAEMRLGGMQKQIENIPSVKRILGNGFYFAEVAPQLVYRFIEQTLQPGPSVSLKCK